MSLIPGDISDSAPPDSAPFLNLNAQLFYPLFLLIGMYDSHKLYYV